MVASFAWQFYKCRIASKCDSVKQFCHQMYISLKSVRLVIERLFFFGGGSGVAKFLEKMITVHKEFERMSIRFRF